LAEENPDDFYFFYQSSTGENLFLHNVSYKLFHQQYNQNYLVYPLSISATVLEIEYDILDLRSQRPDKRMKYLDHLPDTTPFGLVEVEATDLVKQEAIT